MSHRPLRVSLLPVLALVVQLQVSAGRAQAQVTVTAADPPAAEQGLVLDVEVLGSGFKKNAVARFYVAGTGDPGGVLVNSTRYVNSGRLVANITIADAAALGRFDIEVANPDGRTGKGTELFSVLPKLNGAAACVPQPAEYGSPIGSFNAPILANPDGTGVGLGIGADTRVVTIGGQPVLLAAIGSANGNLEVFFLDPVSGALLDNTTIGGVLQPHATLVGAGGRHVRVGDFNGDGEPDVAAASQGRNGVFVTMGSRTGAGALAFGSAERLPSPSVAVGGTGYSVAVGDIDGNPFTDEIAAGFLATSGGKSAAPARLAVYRYNTSSSAFEIAALVTPSGYGSGDSMGGNLSVGDVTGDGKADLIAGAAQKAVGRLSNAGEVAVFAQAADGSFNSVPTFVLRAASPRRDDNFGFRTVVEDADGGGDRDLLILTAWMGSDIRGDLVAGPIAANGNIVPAKTVRPIPGFGGGWATTGAEMIDWDGQGGLDIFVGAPNAALSNGCNSPGAAYAYVDGTARKLFQPPTTDVDFGGFGWAVAATPGSPVVLVTEHGRNIGGVVGAGQVWVYVRQ